MENRIYYEYYETPIGTLTIAADSDAVTLVSFEKNEILGAVKGKNLLTERAAFELSEYFGKMRTTFSVPVRFDTGTPFQKEVWRKLLAIPYGETRTYGEIAKDLQKPGAARAVGMANHHNPLAILVPCHRVIGADGTLTGYAGGLWRKKLLLDLESGEKSNTQ